MANPNMQGPGRAGQNISSPGANSPLSPGGSNTPISFRTNVNRSKTKRWVEAKQYSYDGEDWGDEDDDEEEEQPAAPAAVPRPPYANHRTGSSSEVSLRRLSGFMGAENEGRGSPSVDTGADQQKTLPFVRPSELYRRMGSGDSNAEAAVQSPIPPSQDTLPRDDSGSTLSGGTQTAPASVPTIGLPDIQRMSAFGTDFLGGDSTATPASTETSGSLQHNPSQASQASQASQGFTSVVHQAFDVPETPNSTTGSVARSNSDGTSVISPIISNRGPNDDKTPTIPEEPNESGTPVDASTSGPTLIPGHRRDLSLPDRDNSPSKKPAVTEHTPPSGGEAELSSVSPGATPLPEQSPRETSPGTIAKDFVAPLKLGDRKQSGQSGSDGYRGSIPTIVPDPVMNDSPQDADSDRLREEIMRSLSREGSQEPEHIPETQIEQSKEESIPHQYERYWDGQTGPAPDEAARPLVSDSHPDWNNGHPLSPQDPYAAASQAPIAASAPVDEAPQKPRLGRRFSWESSGSAEAPAVAVQTAAVDDTPVPVQSDKPVAPMPEKVGEELPNYDSEGSGSQRIERPRLSIVPPIPESSSPPVQVMGPSDGSERHPTVGTSYVDENKLQGFRDILKLSTPGARVKAFDSTRDQFAVLDTGLNNWLQLTIKAHPEHADVLNVNQSQPTRNSPSRTRFPKLPTLGALGTPREDGTPTSANHLRRPSGNIGTIMNKSAVEQRGKEFLHTAGTFGGKAGGAAKGLFAKGRSKFRATGDKGHSNSRSRSFHFNFSSEPNASQSQGVPPKRNSLNLGTLPVFKFGQNRSATTPLADTNGEDYGEPFGKRYKSQEYQSVLLQNNLQNSSARAVSQPLPTSAEDERLRKEIARRSGLVGEFEREMNDVLGLSPTKSQPEPLPKNEDLTSPSNPPVQREASSQRETGKRQPAQRPKTPPAPLKDAVEPVQNGTGKRQRGQKPSFVLFPTSTVARTQEDNVSPGHPLSKEKSLPGLPPDKSSDELASPESKGAASSSTVLPSIPQTSSVLSIRPVIDIEPSSPPKTPPKDEAFEDAAPPTPPKDLPVLKTSSAVRQPSVSTLGFEDRQANNRLDDDYNTPPSPEEPLSPETSGFVHDKPLPGIGSSTSLPFTGESQSSVDPFAAQRPTTSADVLDSKRRSVGGLPISAPSMQSPLRNEVRYSPATRSSMLSFGSWGRHSNNSKEARPPTPANDLSSRIEASSPAPNGESKMDKLKSFGKRRRASVSDILTGIQGGIQDGIQGLQERINQHESSEREEKEKEKGRPRRLSFGKISSLFARSDTPQPAEGENGTANRNNLGRTDTPDFTLMDPTRTSNLEPRKPHTEFGERDIPGSPSSNDFMPSPPKRNEPMTHQRASTQLPPIASAAALASGRFYSQAQSSPGPPAAQHTRVKSAPLANQMSHSLSPIPPSESEYSTSLVSPKLGSDNQTSQDSQWENDEVQTDSSEALVHEASQHPPIQESGYHDTHPAFRPNSNIRSRKSIDGEEEPTIAVEPRNIAVSGMSDVTLSEHPHRDETRAVHRNDQPVELALRDDSSEEIVMSSTAYPGQEWIPMQY